MTTKLELTQLLAQRNEELRAARLRISVLEGELALRPRPQHAATVTRLRDLATTHVHRVLPPHMAAARAEAMSTGRCVKVQL